MITKNGNRIVVNNGKALANEPSFYIINDQIATFSAITTGGQSRFILGFSQPTQVNVLWGDGTSTLFNTRTDETGRFLFDMSRYGEGAGTLPDPNPFVSNGKVYPNAQDRNIVFQFKRGLLTLLQMTGLRAKKQRFNFPFYRFPNLERVIIADVKETGGTNPFSGGAFYDVDMRGLVNSKINDFRFTGAANNDLAIAKRIPPQLFEMPLEVLQIGGDYQKYSFDESNMNLIGESNLNNTLKSLTIVARFNDNQGLSEAPADPDFPNTGGLPGNFLKLTNLESLGFTGYRTYFSWRQIPIIISQMTWLKEVSFRYSYINNENTNFNIPSNFFENLTQLEVLNLDNLIRHIPNMDFIENLSDTIQHISLMSNSNQVRLDESIMRCFALVKNKSLSEIVLSFHTYAAIEAQTPSGTYQEPEDLNNPASPLEAIWVMRTIYNCTITYQE